MYNALFAQYQTSHRHHIEMSSLSLSFQFFDLGLFFYFKQYTRAYAFQDDCSVVLITKLSNFVKGEWIRVCERFKKVEAENVIRVSNLYRNSDFYS